MTGKSVAVRRRAITTLAFTALLGAMLQTVPGMPTAAAASGTTERASLGPDNTQILAGVDVFQAISGDGRVVAFVTSAGLVAEDSNEAFDLYRRDLGSGRVDLVTANIDGIATGGIPSGAYDFALSFDGSRVAFESQGDNLVEGDTDGKRDIFVRAFGDASLGDSTVQANLNHDGTPPADGPSSNANAFRLSLSADGNRVAFEAITPLTDNATGETASGIFIRDLARSQTIRVTSGSGSGSALAISDDGESVAYEIRGLASRALHLFHNGSTILVTEEGARETAPPDDYIGGAGALSLDGTVLAFNTDQPLIEPDANGRTDGFVFRADTGQLTRVTVADDESEGFAGGVATTITDDGRKVVFASSSDEFAPTDPVGFQVYVRDTAAGSTTLESVNSDGVMANNASWNPDMSRDGSVVSFTSDATNLAADDSNNNPDIYVHTMRPTDGFTLTVAPAGQKAGVSDIPTGQIDLGLLPLLPGELESAPLRSSPLRSSPLRSSPLLSSPLRSSPLRSSPLRSSPLRSSPLRSSPALSAAHQLPPIPLSTVALLLDGGWAPRLVDTPKHGMALQSVTLQDVIELAVLGGDTPTYPQLATLTLADIDLTATPLRSSPLQGFLFAGPKLADLSPTTDWCTRVPVPDCDATTWTLLDLVLAGAAPSQLRFVADLPVSGATLAGAPIAQYDVGSTDPTAAGLGAIAVGDLPSGMVDCSRAPVGAACTTLAEAVATNAIVDDPAQSAFGRILADANLVGSTTFGDLIRAVVDPTKISYTGVNLGALVHQAPFDASRFVTYTAAATVPCAAARDMSLTVRLPGGFRYVPGSSELSINEGDPNTDDPSAEPVDRDSVDRLALAGPTLQWPVPDCDGSSGAFSLALTFDASPGVRLGKATSSAWLQTSPTDVFASVIDAAPVVVGDALEPNDAEADATPLVPGTLYVSHISGPADVDMYRLPDELPAGTQVTAVLSHLPADFDLFLDGPVAAPLRSSPLRSSPLRSSPLEDLGVTGDAGGDVIEPDTLQDIPLRSSVLSQSATGGRQDEQVSTVLTAATSADTPATLAVTHHLGSSSSQPYLLQVSTTPPPKLHCPAPAPASPFAGSSGVAGSLPSLSGLSTAEKAERKTLFLVNAKRLGDSSSKADADAVLAKLDTLSARPEVGGVVVPVEGDSTVAAAYATWDANRCDAEAANAVVRAIGQVVDNYAGQLPELRYITFVGDDDIVPFARIPDGVTLSNQRDYHPEVVFNGVDNPISAAYGLGYVLSDNPLLAKEGIDFLGHQLPVPSFAGGRLVETPAEIIGTIDQYVLQPHITLDRTLVTGYDFLTDSTEALDTAFAVQNPTASRQKLNDDTWSRQDLKDALADAPTVAAINAHYDHSNTLPADGDASGSPTPDLFTASDLRDSGLPASALLFTLGCQGGLSVPGRAWAAATTDQATRLQDFAQVLAQKKANGFFANTGFGYGDTVAVAYSERLLELFTLNLDGSMTVAQAVSKSKLDYLKEGLVSVYDEKVLNEATFYGLPFVTVGASGSAAPAPAPPAADGSGVTTFLGTSARTFSTTLTYSPVSTSRGSYYTVTGERPLIEHFRPIQPAVSEELPAPPAGTELGDVWFTDLTSLAEEAATDPVFVTPTVDQGAYSPEPLIADVNFPVSLGTVTPAGTVALFPGQYRSDDSAPGSGTQLRFSQMDYRVFYPTSPDAVRPAFTSVDAVASSAGTRFHIGVDDAEHVGVLYKPVGSNNWVSAFLTQVSPGVWVGVLPDVQVEEYLVQAVNDGRVGTTRAKGLNYTPSPDEVTLTPTSSTPAGNPPWYRTPVTVDVAGGDYEASIDGGDFVPLPQTISTDGAHRVDYREVGTTEVTTIGVPIDQTEPTITITHPNTTDQVSSSNDEAQFTCADATSGIASCEAVGGSQLDTSPGTHTFSVKAVDVAGNERIETVQYEGTSYTFEGFFAPVENPPVLNVIQAGSTVPVKFRLRHDGDLVTDTAAVTSITTTSFVCTSATNSTIEETSAPGSASGLTYDSSAQRFQYNWKTVKGSTGCRKLTFTFADGNSRYALFLFRK